MSPHPPHGERAKWMGNSVLKPILEYYRFWERRVFVRGAIARREETWAKTLDLQWWLSPTNEDATTRW
ncbi:uncharacterized protein EKO05_0009394 [Ascochyta rabiei]|uniref:uncharacterized protein n=1 Tax=Didymella rabiei TaxID=5454 RepID=UPI00220776A0|nr:uncharacterized protein EKO05_0009394 [Ascochyta rabiei]UPX19122.1 hypothetical protein EKO05_0009394 [Ascochyta rabiei]